MEASKDFLPYYQIPDAAAFEIMKECCSDGAKNSGIKKATIGMNISLLVLVIAILMLTISATTIYLGILLNKTLFYASLAGMGVSILICCFGATALNITSAIHGRD